MVFHAADDDGLAIQVLENASEKVAPEGERGLARPPQ
jgi:hypothetical protein